MGCSRSFSQSHAVGEGCALKLGQGVQEAVGHHRAMSSDMAMVENYLRDSVRCELSKAGEGWLPLAAQARGGCPPVQELPLPSKPSPKLVVPPPSLSGTPALHVQAAQAKTTRKSRTFWAQLRRRESINSWSMHSPGAERAQNYS